MLVSTRRVANRVVAGLVAGEREFVVQSGVPLWAARMFVGFSVTVCGTALVAFSDEIKSMVSKVVSDVLRDDSVTVSTRDLVADVLHDDALRRDATTLLQTILRDPETIASLSVVLNDPSIQTELQRLVSWVLEDERTIQSVTKVLEDERTIQSLSKMLHDPELQANASSSLSEIAADKSLQHDVGEALWNAVLPTFLRA